MRRIFKSIERFSNKETNKGYLYFQMDDRIF
jgi:hypothetical protein